jgi:hypothetical protein
MRKEAHWRLGCRLLQMHFATAATTYGAMALIAHTFSPRELES